MTNEPVATTKSTKQAAFLRGGRLFLCAEPGHVYEKVSEQNKNKN
jgi:hypothetical protein